MISRKRILVVTEILLLLLLVLGSHDDAGGEIIITRSNSIRGLQVRSHRPTQAQHHQHQQQQNLRLPERLLVEDDYTFHTNTPAPSATPYNTVTGGEDEPIILQAEERNPETSILVQAEERNVETIILEGALEATFDPTSSISSSGSGNAGGGGEGEDLRPVEAAENEKEDNDKENVVDAGEGPGGDGPEAANENQGADRQPEPTENTGAVTVADQSQAPGYWDISTTEEGEGEGEDSQGGEASQGEGQIANAELPGGGEDPTDDVTHNGSESEGIQQEVNNPQNDEQMPGEGQEAETTAPGSQAFTDEDNFVPVLDAAVENYYVDLRTFSVFVDADRDLTTDLGIPLYLLLEMGVTLENIVNVLVTNLTIQMGVTHIDPTETSGSNRRSLAIEVEQVPDHIHWNELLFEGVAEFAGGGGDEVVQTPATVQNAQLTVFLYPDNLQAFWDDEGGKVYQSLELVNITMLAAPAASNNENQDDGKLVDIQPTMTPEEQTQQLNNEVESSKKSSNVWVMVPLVIFFFAICICCILFAGRLQYLGSRAQEKYNEKYGLDYNVYDKDISKDIFKEEYLMSEHEDTDFYYNSGGQGFHDSLGSIDIVNSIKAVKVSSKARNAPVADDETPTEEEELNGSSEDSREMFSNEDLGASSSSSKRKGSNFAARAPGEDGSFPSETNAQDVGASPPLIPVVVSEEVFNDESQEAFNDESQGSSQKSERSSNNDNGDTLPELLDMSSPRDQRILRSIEPQRSIELPPSDDGSAVMGNMSSRSGGSAVMGNLSSRSGKDRSYRSMRSTDSVGSGKDGSGVMGNTSGRSQRSTRSQRSFGSFPSDDSFYSCQGDLV